MLSSAIIIAYGSPSSAISTKVSLNPPVISGLTLGIGGEFVVSANITNVNDLWGWSLGLTWDPSILQMINYSEGSFLNSSGQTSLTASPIDNNDGTIQNINDVLDSQNSASGSGILASFSFQIIGTGSTAINLTNVQLFGPVSSTGSNPQIPLTEAGAVFNGVQIIESQDDPTTPTGTFSAVQSGTGGTTNVNSITVPASPNPIGTTVSIDIYISGAANIWGWTIPTVSWNPAVMNITHAAFGPYLADNTPGDDTTSGVGTSSSLYNYAGGYIAGGLSEAIEGNDVAVGSSGVVATLTFVIVGYGTSPVNLGGAYLPTEADPESGPTATCNNATVNVLSSTSPTSTPTPTPTPTSAPTPTPTPSPTQSSTHSPIASFTPLNGTVYYVGDTVLLDASGSAAGSDNGVTCEISNYAWLVEYSNNSLFGAFSGEMISFSVSSAENLQIILVVTAPDANPSPSSSYTNTSTTSAWIQVENPVQQEAEIQVFTAKGGLGNSNGGVYGPQQLVTMYALVTFGGAPVVDKEVTFAVLFPNETVCALVTGTTNETGFATWSFRLPWPSSDPQSLFGTWSIVASVDVSQVVVTGSVNFTFNYTILITSIQVPASVQRSESGTMQVTVQSSANFQGVLTVTICDSQQVPIFFSTVNIDATAGVADTITLDFTVPSWAFVGTATVYSNVLTALPTNGGVALCPQETANFQITSS